MPLIHRLIERVLSIAVISFCATNLVVGSKGVDNHIQDWVFPITCCCALFGGLYELVISAGRSMSYKYRLREWILPITCCCALFGGLCKLVVSAGWNMSFK